MAEEQYKAFADNPTLDSLQNWLINNKRIEVPLADEKRESVAEDSNTQYKNDGKERPATEVWLRFFIHRKHLNTEGFLRKMWQECPDECVAGRLADKHNQDLRIFKALLKEHKDEYKAEFGDHLSEVLSGSDQKASLRPIKQKGMQSYRKAELEKVFGDEEFRQKLEEFFGSDTVFDAQDDADGVAVLVIVALLNIKCSGERLPDPPQLGMELVLMPDGDVGIRMTSENLLRDIQNHKNEEIMDAFIEYVQSLSVKYDMSILEDYVAELLDYNREYEYPYSNGRSR